MPMLCALPIIGVAVWFLAGKNINNAATIALFLACPLGHMFLMKHGDHDDHNGKPKGTGHKNHQ